MRVLDNASTLVSTENASTEYASTKSCIEEVKYRPNDNQKFKITERPMRDVKAI